jgi:hypothetical protein
MGMLSVRGIYPPKALDRNKIVTRLLMLNLEINLGALIAILETKVRAAYCTLLCN